MIFATGVLCFCFVVSSILAFMRMDYSAGFGWANATIWSLNWIILRYKVENHD